VDWSIAGGALLALPPKVSMQSLIAFGVTAFELWYWCAIENLVEFIFSCVASQDARDGLLGRLFAYGSLVRSKRLIGDGTSSEEKEVAKEIVEQLFTLAKRKTFLREPAVNLVIELANGVCKRVYLANSYCYCFEVANLGFKVCLRIMVS